MMKPLAPSAGWQRFVMERQGQSGSCLSTDRELSKRAVVFAPHMDDETLGCGGTILRKRQSGAEVTVVFLTDGSASHSRFMPAEELVALRQQEALNALSVLDVDARQAVFLGAKDGGLARAGADLLPQLVELIGRLQPEQVFVPFRSDPPSDHAATTRLVLQALHQCGWSGEVYEYPIWYWNHWPWVGIPLKLGRRARAVIKNTLRFGFGTRVGRVFSCWVDVEAVLPRKRQALEQYVSQMQHLGGDHAWPTLPEVAGGAFLACFFRPFEIFHSETWPLEQKTR